jgi:hypothetical protein
MALAEDSAFPAEHHLAEKPGILSPSLPPPKSPYIILYCTQYCEDVRKSGGRYQSVNILKGLSHEIFGPVFWAVWIYLDLNVNRLNGFKILMMLL